MKILVVFASQWGYNTDYLFFCKLLSLNHDVTYIGYDLGLPKVESENVKCINVPYSGKTTILTFHKEVAKEGRSGGYTHILVNYFLTCSLLFLTSRTSSVKMVDVRTSFIYKSKFKTELFNLILKLETSLFRYITVVSNDVAKYLKLPTRSIELPLGGPIFEPVDKDFTNLRFLYVGTFYDRNICNTILAFARLISSHGHLIDMKYTIIGYGSTAEVAEIVNLISSQKLTSYVSFKGTIRYPELTEYFLTHNVGVSYIPQTAYYDGQPPTKTFEYLLSGNIVLGTNTTANRKVVNKKAGILVEDNVDDFYNGMVKVFEKRLTFNSREIQINANRYSWNAIVDNILIPKLIEIEKI